LLPVGYDAMHLSSNLNRPVNNLRWSPNAAKHWSGPSEATTGPTLLQIRNTLAARWITQSAAPGPLRRSAFMAMPFQEGLQAGCEWQRSHAGPRLGPPKAPTRVCQKQPLPRALFDAELKGSPVAARRGASRVRKQSSRPGSLRLTCGGSRHPRDDPRLGASLFATVGATPRDALHRVSRASPVSRPTVH
jgi:hypothetical protein